MINLSHLSADGAARTINGFTTRFRSEDPNRVIRDAHRVLPGFTAAMTGNLRVMRIHDAFHQSVIDVVKSNNPRLQLAGDRRSQKPAPRRHKKQLKKAA